MRVNWNAAGGLAGMKLILVACNVASVQRDAPRSANEKISDSFFEQFWAENSNNRIAARNMIVASVCPQLCNVFDPKLALLLMLLGGVQGHHGGSHIRGNCHMLLVGDPGSYSSLHTFYKTCRLTLAMPVKHECV
jgi:DNA replicative helicase MCM subunit Mcm2 (Cdc46/Mcm family)